MSKLSDYLEQRVLELFHEAGNVRPNPRLRVRVDLIGLPRVIRTIDRISREFAATLLLRSNRRRRSSILCKIGLHDWEAWELKLPGLMFVKRCRRRGCKAARAIKPRTLGPTEMLSKFEESERIAARMEAIRGLRPDIARDSDRLFDSWHSREGGSHG